MARRQPAYSKLDEYEAKIRAWKEREGLSFTAIAEKLRQEHGVEVKHNTVHYFLKRRQKVEEVGEGADSPPHVSSEASRQATRCAKALARREEEGESKTLSEAGLQDGNVAALRDMIESFREDVLRQYHTLESLRQGLDERFDNLHSDLAEPILALAQAVRDVEATIAGTTMLVAGNEHRETGLVSPPRLSDSADASADCLLPLQGGARPMMAFSEVQLDRERATRIDYWLRQNLWRIWGRALGITALFWSGALCLWWQYGDAVTAWLHPWLLW